MLFKKTEQTKLQKEIDRVLLLMQTESPSSPEYSAIVKNLETLSKTDKFVSESRVNPETLLTVGANLAGIAMILQHENAHALASKALGFVVKTRI